MAHPYLGQWSRPAGPSPAGAGVAPGAARGLAGALQRSLVAALRRADNLARLPHDPGLAIYSQDLGVEARDACCPGLSLRAFALEVYEPRDAADRKVRTARHSDGICSRHVAPYGPTLHEASFLLLYRLPLHAPAVEVNHVGVVPIEIGRDCLRARQMGKVAVYERDGQLLQLRPLTRSKLAIRPHDNGRWRPVRGKGQRLTICW